MELEKTKPSLNITFALLGVPGFPQDITRKQNGQVKKAIPANEKQGCYPAADCLTQKAD